MSLSPEVRANGIGESLSTVTVPAVQTFLVRKNSLGLEFFLGHRSAGAYLKQWSPPGGAIDGKSEMEAVLEELK
jgi:hypothetical protein